MNREMAGFDPGPFRLRAVHSLFGQRGVNPFMVKILLDIVGWVGSLSKFMNEVSAMSRPPPWVGFNTNPANLK